MKKQLILLIAVFLLPACAAQQGPAKAELPAGKAHAEGKEIYMQSSSGMAESARSA
jgi:uncharacterized lipoprotein YajG